MEETLAGYARHYLMNIQGLLFWLAALAVLLVIMLVLQVTAKDQKELDIRSQSLFELIFCGGAILGFMAVYYLINRFCTDGPFREFWDTYNDYLLLGMIIVSILMNRLVDHFVVKLTISHEDKTAVRLISMGYMIVIFFYIKFIYENNNYDMFITYFLCLMIGRFVYFDVSFGDFSASMRSAARKLPILLIALIYVSIMSWIGFKSGYLIKHIGVITNVFFIHLFMIVAIAVVFYGEKIFRRRAKRGEVK